MGRAMTRHVAWLIGAPIERHPIDGLTSKLASARYRCLIPACELRNLNVRCSIFSNLYRADPILVGRKLQQLDVDIVVVGKLLGPSLLETARIARSQGRYLIADFTDDFFRHPRLGSLHRELAQLADKMVASTLQMAEAIEQNTQRASVVVLDPYEGPKGEPKFAPRRERLELLWFGNAINFRTLGPVLPQLAALSERQPLRLTVVTALSQIASVPGQLPPNFSVNLAEWSCQALWQHLAACDVVIIPSLPAPHYSAKSPNRLVEAIWAGRAVAAYPVASYCEFRDVCWLGKNIAEGIAWMTRNSGLVQKQIAAGQTLIAKKYAPPAVAAQWLECFDFGDASSSCLA